MSATHESQEVEIAGLIKGQHNISAPFKRAPKRMIAFLLVVFDGLRPDMLRPDTTPNLVRFAAMGTRFARARSVFPSETRVCSASVATGCLPRRHGLVANQFAHPLRPAQRLDTGLVEELRAFEQEAGAPLLEAPTLGEIVAAAGRDCIVLSSGTTGQTHVLNPRADVLGQVTLSAHGPHGCSPAGRRLLAKLEPPPSPPPERAAWIAEVFRTRFLPAPPALTILWLCEPDSSGHYAGLGSPAQLAALQTADAAFGRILDDWERGPQRDTLHIAVASDHGHARISGHVDAAAALAGTPAFEGCTLLPGSSGGIFVPGADPQRVGALAEWLTWQDWCGTVYAADFQPLATGRAPARSPARGSPARRARALHTAREGGHHAVRRWPPRWRRHARRSLLSGNEHGPVAGRQPCRARMRIERACRADRSGPDRPGTPWD